MTFSIPDDVAESLARAVPEAEQSGYVAGLLRGRLEAGCLTTEEWATAADAANADETLNSEIDEWQAFSDPIAEPWDATSSR